MPEASRTDAERQPLTNAERQRRHRQCVQRGVRVESIEIGKEFLKRLAAEGWLEADIAENWPKADKDSVAKVQAVIADFQDCYGRKTLRPDV